MNKRLQAKNALKLADVWAGSEATYDAVLDAKINADAKLAAAKEEVTTWEDMLPPLYERMGSVGVVKVEGSLIPGQAGMMRLFGATGYDDIANALVQAVGDKEAKSIMLYVDSGGGSVAGVRDAVELVRNVAQVKPMSVYSAFAASAAYWLASAAGHITTGDTSINGSIGVLRIHTEYSKAYEMEGITRTVLRAGQYKALGNSVEPLSDVAKAQEQERLDYLYRIFAGDVAENRSTTYTVADSIMGQGREFIGTQGLDVGLVDKIGNFQDALAYAGSNRTLRSKNSVNLGQTATANIEAGRSMADNQAVINLELTMKKNLTPEQLAAIAAGVPVEAAVGASATVTIEPEAGAPEAASSSVAVEDAVQAEIDLVKAAMAGVEVKNAELMAQLDVAKASASALRAIVESVVSNMHVAMNKKSNLAEMSVDDLVVAHTEAVSFVKDKFKVGAVAQSVASTEPEQPSEAKAQAQVDPMFVYRVQTLAKK